MSENVSFRFLCFYFSSFGLILHFSRPGNSVLSALDLALNSSFMSVLVLFLGLMSISEGTGDMLQRNPWLVLGIGAIVLTRNFLLYTLLQKVVKND